MANLQLSLSKVIGSPFCVSIADGNVVHAKIAEAIDNGDVVEISFDGVKRLTTAFLNAAIGQLYNEYSEDKVRASLKIISATQDDLHLIVRVVENAKAFFRSSERTKSVIRGNLVDE